MQYATDLSGAAPADVRDVVEGIIAAERIDIAALREAGKTGRVFIAKDTRPSSESLSARVRAGVEALGAAVTDFGLFTTPELHFVVRETNAGRASRASVAGYAAMMRHAYADLLDGSEQAASAAARGPVVIDCANGVGGIAGAVVRDAMAPLVDLRLRNTGSTPAEVLSMNDGCGAEHCQKERLPPLGFSAAADGGARCASLDGDADRLVYHYFDAPAAGGSWVRQ